MKDRPDTTRTCARAETLVAYLYNEAGEAEAKDFEAHIRGCDSCEAELAAFQEVRTSIVAWRQQVLPAIESTAPAAQTSPALETANPSTARKPSALAALREFLALSPVWLRAGAAFAGLAICALVVFAAARVLEGPRVVERVVERGPSDAEVNALVDRKVREQIAARTALAGTYGRQPAVTDDAQHNLVVARSKTGRSGSVSRHDGARKSFPARVSSQEYEELARDLQLIPARDEEDLPRLIDLMDEAN
jgi:anti-sigma factor RsiW